MRTPLLALLAVSLLPGSPLPAHPGEKHDHPHNAPHPTVADPARFTTSRDAAALPLPGEEDAFFFVVFGDRTGGPAEGIEVLKQAVADTNLLEPDLVMTVGDLVEGYNAQEEWMVQMQEYTGVMDGLLMPWFPVVGNHDIYWRGPDRPEGEHEADYETHFGPLWYAFEHKNCWFVALYSDEGNPETGEKSFEKPESQRMSPEQFAWLAETLEQADEAQHIFLFLHHPRWLGGNYGDDWNRVHDLLVEAGNVTAVFAGHIHRMRYDGPRDGIEYVTLATVGGAQNGAVPEAGYLHQFHVVTVRKNQVAMASIPVGEVMDVREITGTVSDETRRLAGMRPAVDAVIPLSSDGSAQEEIAVRVVNPVSRPIEITLTPHSEDSRWIFQPQHVHGTLQPGGSAEFGFRVHRMADPLDETFRLPELTLSTDYLTEARRYRIPDSTIDLPMNVSLPEPAHPADEHVLLLDGEGDYAMVESEAIALPDGPMTLECWFSARSFGSRTALLCKTENSEYGFFVSNGRPGFFLYLGDRYVELETPGAILQTGRWHHLAGVYDGSEVRLYVDGHLLVSEERSGIRRRNDFPLLIGADVDSRGRPVSFFNGLIDEVRLSSAARYAGESFTPARRHEADASTLLLLNFDAAQGPFLYDASGREAHAVLRGEARVGGE